MTLGLKFLSWTNRNFWFKKNLHSDRYLFSIAINLFLWDKNNVEFSGRDQEKITWNFQGSWLALKFMKGVTQLCGVFRGEALFCLEYPRVK